MNNAAITPSTMKYDEVLDNMHREVAACKSVSDALTLEETCRSYLRREAPRAHKAGCLRSFMVHEREVRKLIVQLREEWPHVV